MDLYVYYRVPAEDAERFAALARETQSALARRHGVAAALKRRPEAADGLHTWMEVYHDVAPGFEDALTAAVAASGLAGRIRGERHVERFLDMTACA